LRWFWRKNFKDFEDPLSSNSKTIKDPIWLLENFQVLENGEESKDFKGP